jgi:hypothetical protein
MNTKKIVNWSLKFTLNVELHEQINCTTNKALYTCQVNKQPHNLTKALFSNEQSIHDSLTHVL